MKGAPVPIQGALRETLQAQGLGHILYEARLRERWQDVMGAKAARIAEMDAIRDGRLDIRVPDAAWRQELHFQREALRKRANEILGTNVVRDVRLR